MHFDVISEITDIETIAVGSQAREVKRLRKQYGQGRWRKPLTLEEHIKVLAHIDRMPWQDDLRRRVQH